MIVPLYRSVTDLFLTKLRRTDAKFPPNNVILSPIPINRLCPAAVRYYAHDMIDKLDALRARVLRHRPGPTGETAIPNLRLAAFDRRTVPTPLLCEPMICVVLQGLKQVTVGGRLLRFEPGRCFISTITVPAMSAVLEADDMSPYLAVALTLDLDLLTDLLWDEVATPKSNAMGQEGFGLDRAPDLLLNALDALVALLDTPEDVAALSRGREREVLYRLLKSGHGDMLRRLACDGSQASQIRIAVETIRRNAGKSLRIEDLASIAGMSVASFHRHFKSVTSMTPLQYQKTLRLHAARRLLSASPDVTSAAFAVGYESLSQFGREYSRLFGLSPSRDAARMRQAVPLSEEYAV